MQRLSEEVRLSSNTITNVNVLFSHIFIRMLTQKAALFYSPNNGFNSASLSRESVESRREEKKEESKGERDRLMEEDKGDIQNKPKYTPQVEAILKRWIESHLRNPFPNYLERAELCK